MRIGAKMAELVWWVRQCPGEHMSYYARMVGPNGSLNYGYRTVHRAISAGIVATVPGARRGTWRLVPAD